MFKLNMKAPMRNRGLSFLRVDFISSVHSALKQSESSKPVGTMHLAHARAKSRLHARGREPECISLRRPRLCNPYKAGTQPQQVTQYRVGAYPGSLHKASKVNLQSILSHGLRTCPKRQATLCGDSLTACQGKASRRYLAWQGHYCIGASANLHHNS